MVITQLNKDYVYNLLSVIPDPEIPVVSIVDMGMVRDVHIHGDIVEIILTPTYMGCPAMRMIEADILATLKLDGIGAAKVTLTYSPAWTTEWMSAETKLKLHRYGIAPPTAQHQKVACPQCGSENTTLISQFGATACKALYKCTDCKEPFEHFKCH